MYKTKMVKNDAISIITIVLNQQVLIEQTIKSVISQPGIDIEYIIIDGGSTDGTLDIINLYRQHIKHIVSEPDNGIYDAINKGIALASCPLIGLIHCGDFYKPNILKYVNQAFQQSHADVIYGDIEIMEQIGDEMRTKVFGANHRLLKSEMSLFHPSTFITLSSYRLLGTYDTRYKSSADYELLLRFLLNNCIFFHVPLVLACFRTGGTSGNNFNRALTENFKIRKKHIGLFNAVVRSTSVIITHSVLRFRNFLIITILGKSNYNKLKLKFNNKDGRSL